MAILIPQISAKLESRAGTDVYGSPTYKLARTIRVGVVKLKAGSRESSVRADSSASRGWSEEEVASSVLLFETKDTPQILDRVTVQGITLQITGFHPRFDLMGNQAHWQVDLAIESS